MIDRSSFETVRITAYKRAGEGKTTPRWIRKMIARTVVHRALMQGESGSFLLPILERQPINITNR